MLLNMPLQIHSRLPLGNMSRLHQPNITAIPENFCILSFTICITSLATEVKVAIDGSGSDHRPWSQNALLEHLGSNGDLGEVTSLRPGFPIWKMEVIIGQ